MLDDGYEECDTPSALYRRNESSIQQLEVDSDDGVLSERYLLILRSLQSDFDYLGGHYKHSAVGQLTANPQRPGDLTCSSPSGYQVAVLMYTRNRSIKRMGTLKSWMPSLPWL
jgi:hypothetical protein